MNDSERYTNLANLLAAGTWPQSYYSASQLAGLTSEQLLALNENMANLVTGTQEVTAISQAQLDAFAVEAYTVTFYSHKGLNKPMNTIQRSINKARVDSFRKASVGAADTRVNGWVSELTQSRSQGLVLHDLDSALYEILSTPELRNLFQFVEDATAEGRYWLEDITNYPGISAGWVAEESLIPMLSGTIKKYELSSNMKIASMVTISDEVWKLDNANEFVQNLLFQHLFQFLDASFMGVQSATASTNPAGIFQMAQTSSVTGTDITLEDLENAIFNALGELMTVSKTVMIFANPGTLLLAKRALNAGVLELDNVHFIPTASIPAGKLQLLCPSKVAMVATGTPEILVSNDGTVMMTDDSSLSVNDVFTNTGGQDDKSVSLFQQQMSAVRGLYPINFALVDDTAAHVISNFKLG